MTKDRQLVFALVEENNDISIAFHEKNGYVHMPFKVSFMEYFQEAKENKVNVKSWLLLNTKNTSVNTNFE